MTNNRAQEIIERAMRDRTVYDAMAARESEVWGKILPARELSKCTKRRRIARRRKLEKRSR